MPKAVPKTTCAKSGLYSGLNVPIQQRTFVEFKDTNASTIEPYETNVMKGKDPRPPTKVVRLVNTHEASELNMEDLGHTPPAITDSESDA